MVERIGCGANRSIGGSVPVAQQVNIEQHGETAGPVIDTVGGEEYTTIGRITGLVDLTDQFDANHSFAIYGSLGDGMDNSTLVTAWFSLSLSRACRSPSSLHVVFGGRAFGN